MRKVLTVLLAVTVMFTLLTACGNEPKAKKVASKAAVTQEDTSSSAPDSSSSEAITTTSKAPEGTILTPEVTQAPSAQAPTSGTAAPKVTTKTPQQTVAPKVTQATQTQKKLIVPTVAQCAVIENEVMRLVNQYRVSLGRSPYTKESKLIQGARIRAEEASHINCFGHERPDGSKWSTVLTDVKYGTPYNKSYYGANGEILNCIAYGAGAAAENLTAFDNLFFGKNYYECSNAELKAVAQEMFDGWKASPDHNKSMINTIYTKMGVGVYSKYEINRQGQKVVAFYGIQLFTQE